MTGIEKTVTNRSGAGVLVLCAILFGLCACTEDASYTAGVWYRRSDFDGVARTDAAGFTIGNKGYICGGYNGKTTRLADTWEYDIDNDWWTQRADMPGTVRNAATGFPVGNKGYITTGYNPDQKYLADTWEYDPETNTWRQMDDFKGGARYYALGFGIDNYGYVGTGYNDNYLKDFLSIRSYCGSRFAMDYREWFRWTKASGSHSLCDRWKSLCLWRTEQQFRCVGLLAFRSFCRHAVDTTERYCQYQR